MSNEFKIGLTVLGAIIIAFIGFRYLQDAPLFKESNKLHSTFPRVDGLNAGSYVYLNGVKVGSVKEIELTRHDSVRITMNVDLDLRIPKDSKALLRPVDLLGSKAVVIQKGNARQAIPNGGRIEGVFSEGMMEILKDEGQKLGDNISNSVDNVNRLAQRLNKVVDQNNRKGIERTIENIEGTSGRISAILENKSQSIQSSISHAEEILRSIDTVAAGNRDKIENIIANLDTTSQELSRLTGDFKRTNQTLDTILTKIDSGRGSLGKMLNNPSLYHNLDSLATNLKRISKDFEEHPGKYLKNMRLIELF